MSSYKLFSDEVLLSMLCRDDHGAYTEIFHRYKHLLYLHAYRLLKNREDAREVVQELFVTLWNRRSVLPVTTCLSAYLYTSVRNSVLKIISHKRVESAYFTSIKTYFREGSAVADHLVRQKELAFAIEKEINELPPRMRTIFNLSRKGYLSHGEIADRLSLSPATVKKQVNNALKILRVKLGHFLLLLL